MPDVSASVQSQANHDFQEPLSTAPSIAQSRKDDKASGVDQNLMRQERQRYRRRRIGGDVSIAGPNVSAGAWRREADRTGGKHSSEDHPGDSLGVRRSDGSE